MADGVEVKVIGLEAINRNFGALPQDIRLKGARFAARRAAVQFQKAVVATSSTVDDPVTAEQISKNVAVRFSPRYYKQTGDVMFRVGILGGARSDSKEAEKGRRRRAREGVSSLSELGEIAGKGSGNPGGDTWYWRLVNFGTKRSRDEQFMEKAIERATGPARDTFIVQMGRWLDRHAAKLAKGGGAK